MLHHRINLLPSLLAVLLLLSALAASAEIVIYSGDEDVPQAGALPAATAGQIGVNASLALDIPGAGGGVPLNVRAEILDTRMTEILSAGIAGPITIGDIRGKPTIWVGEYRLVTVYPEDAAAKGMSMQDLAASWAETVRATILKCSNPLGPGADEVRGAVPQG
jgi:hypothetical protein